MNLFILSLLIVQIWDATKPSQAQATNTWTNNPGPLTNMIQQLYTNPSPAQPVINEMNRYTASPTTLVYKLLLTIPTNPWTLVMHTSLYLNTTLLDGQLSGYNKAVAHFGLNDDMTMHQAHINMLEQGLRSAQQSTGPLVANDTELLKELIADSNLYGFNYYQKYADPIIGPIPDRIKQLPLRDDTQDYIRRLNFISQTNKVQPVLAAHLACLVVYATISKTVMERVDYKPNVLLPLLTYDGYSEQNLKLVGKISLTLNAHYEAGMTPDEVQQTVDAFESIYSAEIRSQYGRAFVEEMGAYVRQPGDSQPFLKQHMH